MLSALELKVEQMVGILITIIQQVKYEEYSAVGAIVHWGTL